MITNEWVKASTERGYCFNCQNESVDGLDVNIMDDTEEEGYYTIFICKKCITEILFKE